MKKLQYKANPTPAEQKITESVANRKKSNI